MPDMDQKQGCQLQARFVLGPDNATPLFIQSGRFRHYRVVFSVRCDGSPPAVVTYILAPSYKDPIREVTDSKGAFELKTTAYGDYVVQAKLRAEQGVKTVQESLSRLLERSHAGAISPAVKDAIEAIRKN